MLDGVSATWLIACIHCYGILTVAHGLFPIWTRLERSSKLTRERGGKSWNCKIWLEVLYYAIRNCVVF